MARLRKAAKQWRRPDSRAAAARVLIGQDVTLFTVEPELIFGRRAPLEVELGSGKGDFIIEQALRHPERDFLAVELAPSVARLLATRCGRAELPNLRVAAIDARPLVNLFLPDSCVAAFHIYFPDPWPKARHHKHRMLSPRTVAGIARSLASGGQVHVASDVAQWAEEMFTMFRAGGFEQSCEQAPGASATGFARKYGAIGKPVYSASFVLGRSSARADSLRPV
ncbi:MAG TPA: hypothetical protein VEJ86_07360 [Candidatus Binataceae bacterium]|nr:hypothetical protein [Candidatus Binataceae bacterium]